MNLDLKLTDSAVEQVKKLLARDQRAGYGLRVGVTDGGCSGFSYKLDFDNQQKAEDMMFEFGGIPIYIDRASAPYLSGTVIDFVTGLHGGGFKFSNPNATGTCGCGTSHFLHSARSRLVLLLKRSSSFTVFYLCIVAGSLARFALDRRQSIERCKNTRRWRHRWIAL
jgi:iron-sulfur cluster assembly accessory protein